MEEHTKQIVDLVVGGLSDRTNFLYGMLLDKEMTYNQKYPKKPGPFHRALIRVADIADGGEIKDRNDSQMDVYMVLSVVDLLPNNYKNYISPVLLRARCRLVPEHDRVTYDEAAKILGVNRVYVDLDVQSDNLHPLVFETQDGNSPTFTFLLDLEEVLKLKSIRQRNAETMEKWKKEKYAQAKESSEASGPSDTQVEASQVVLSQDGTTKEAD